MTTAAEALEEVLARAFHDRYEELAPSFGYETREDTRQFDPKSPNGRLMIRVIADLLPRLRAALAQPQEGEVDKAAEQMDWSQVVLNGGPPCFHIENGRFCGRAERWKGHDALHAFVSLTRLLRATQSNGRLHQTNAPDPQASGNDPSESPAQQAQPRNDQVICPACCHQFTAISVDDQKYRSELEHELRTTKQAQPVAWMMPLGERGLIEWGHKRPDTGDLDKWRPLYSHSHECSDDFTGEIATPSKESLLEDLRLLSNLERAHKMESNSLFIENGQLRKSLKDVLRMLEAAHRQSGIHGTDNKRIVAARSVLNAPPSLYAAPQPDEAVALLRALEPHLDKLICYASTTDEYEPNAIVARIRAYLKDRT